MGRQVSDKPTTLERIAAMIVHVEGMIARQTRDLKMLRSDMGTFGFSACGDGTSEPQAEASRAVAEVLVTLKTLLETLRSSAYTTARGVLTKEAIQQRVAEAITAERDQARGVEGGTRMRAGRIGPPASLSPPLPGRLPSCMAGCLPAPCGQASAAQGLTPPPAPTIPTLPRRYRPDRAAVTPTRPR